MSTSTATIAPTSTTGSSKLAETTVSGIRHFTVDVETRSSGEVPDQLTTAWTRLANRMGLSELEGWGSSKKVDRPEWVTVAPGVAVRGDTYNDRFGPIDLDALRDKMPPRVFAAFVRHIGVVPGREEIDIAEITRIPDDK